MYELNDTEIQSLYEWIDSIPLSRTKRQIARDFSDAVLCAEIIHHHHPKLIDLHNYSPASSHSQKIYNWTTLNRIHLLMLEKAMKRLGCEISERVISRIVSCTAGYIEYFLFDLRTKMEQYKPEKEKAHSMTRRLKSKSPTNSNGYPFKQNEPSSFIGDQEVLKEPQAHFQNTQASPNMASYLKEPQEQHFHNQPPSRNTSYTQQEMYRSRGKPSRTNNDTPANSDYHSYQSPKQSKNNRIRYNAPLNIKSNYLPDINAHNCPMVGVESDPRHRQPNQFASDEHRNYPQGNQIRDMSQDMHQTQHQHYSPRKPAVQNSMRSPANQRSSPQSYQPSSGSLNEMHDTINVFVH